MFLCAHIYGMSEIISYLINTYYITYLNQELKKEISVLSYDNNENNNNNDNNNI